MLDMRESKQQMGVNSCKEQQGSIFVDGFVSDGELLCGIKCSIFEIIFCEQYIWLIPTFIFSKMLQLPTQSARPSTYQRKRRNPLFW